MLVVAGLGGEPDYEATFVELASTSAEQARSGGVNVVELTGDQVSKAALEDAIESIGTSAGRDDTVVAVFFGHGTFDGEHYRFNVPGPDPTADDLAAWLARLRVAREIVVVATSASGALIEELQRDDRTLITATKSGQERVATVFGSYWVDALTDPGADLDKDERISAQEAFEYAQDGVERHYESRDRIATEHPRLIGRTPLVSLARLQPGVEPARFDSRYAGLVENLDDLQRQIDTLRSRKDSLPVDEYYDQLQTLLLELAVVERQIDEAAQ